MWKPIASAASTRLISTRRQSTPASRQLCAVLTRAPRSSSTTSDPPRGSGLAWGGPARRPERGCPTPSLAGCGRLVAADALAELFLLDPAGLHDHIEVVARDRHRSEEARVERDLLFAA